MPKVKTNSGAKKRFALTGTGKIKRKHAYHSHILTKKTKKQKRNLVHTGLVDSANKRQQQETGEGTSLFALIFVKRKSII